MKTTVMFVADSVPLDGASVCRMGEGAEDLYVTDGEGRIEFDLAPGAHSFRIQVDDRWVERTITREGNSPLFVVNVQEQDVKSLATLNTLQIDLANMVGDRYVFETVLGRGGMGVVVKAVDRMLNRPVAIKMLSDELRENEEAQQIFLVEARNLATLSHPNLVAIHDILNVAGRVLMVFEYVLGENVEKTIRRQGALPQKDVLRIAIQLTRCVSYLHEHELIHRDLKPANIIMQADGTLKLVDFGLARSLNDLYMRGTRVRGTPAYMAPEQIQGIHLTTATDIYQLGISIYEMLNGGLPFASGDMAYAHVHLNPPSLEESVEGLDPELARLVHACLAKKPKDRPANAEVLLEHLQQIYARLASGGEPPPPRHITTGPLPAIPQLASPSDVSEGFDEVSLAEEVVGGSNRGLAIMAGVGLLALIVAAVVLTSRRDDPPVVPEPIEPAVVEPVAVVEQPAPVPEPVEQPGDGRAVSAARGLVQLGLATATGQASGLASASQAETQRPRKVARKRETREPVSTPPPRKEVVEVKEAPVTKKQSEPAPKVAESKNGKGLLSVDSGKSKSLLPVGN